MRSAFLLTGNQRYLDAWRKQIDAINSNRRMNNGRYEYPRMYGDEGWYAFVPTPYAENALELYALSMREDDAKRVGHDAWLDYLDGKSANYPEQALQQDLGRIRFRVVGMRRDTTTPDTRLADDRCVTIRPACTRSWHSRWAACIRASVAIHLSPGCAILMQTSGGRGCPRMWRR
jgi:hypothetical protein